MKTIAIVLRDSSRTFKAKRQENNKSTGKMALQEHTQI
jgi:hypothetical protein